MAKTRSKNNFEISAIGNETSYLYYYNRLLDLAISLFEWKNLPETCDERYIETTLFRNGGIAFFEDEEIGMLSLSYAVKGPFDIYGYPNRIDAFSKYNNYHRTLDNTNSVVVFNNMLKQNSTVGVKYYAQRLWALDRIIDINANAQKTPLLLQGSEKDRLTLQNLYMQYDGNEPVIYGGKNLDLNAFTVLRTDAPYVGDKLNELKENIWNEALTYLGITNSNEYKKERQVAGEVNVNQGAAVASRFSKLQTRQVGAEKINKMFGTNIEVDFRENIFVQFNAPESQTYGGVGIE